MGRRPKENWEATLTEWGQRFEKVRAERRMSYNDVVATLRTHEGFEKLNRSTLYRWEFSNRADKMVHLDGRRVAAITKQSETVDCRYHFSPLSIKCSLFPALIKGAVFFLGNA